MSSNGKKAKAIRKWKDRPNKANRKADFKRIQRNAEILKELSEQDRD